MTLHKFVYQYEGNTFLGERYPQQEIIVQSKCEDLDAHEILQLFKSYMVACGYAEKSFYDACETAADENNLYRNKGRDRHEMGETDQIRHATQESWHNGAIGSNSIKDLLDPI